MRLALHSLVERNQLLTCLGVAILILNQHATDTVDRDHMDQVGVERRAIELDNHHLSQLFIQGHTLHKFARQVAITGGSGRGAGHGGQSGHRYNRGGGTPIAAYA